MGLADWLDEPGTVGIPQSAIPSRLMRATVWSSFSMKINTDALQGRA